MIEIRPAQAGDAKGIAKVHVDTWRTTYVEIVPQDHLDKLSYERRAKMWSESIDQPQPRNHLFVAVDGGAIVGFTCGGPNRADRPDFDGEIYAIYLLKDYQGQRLGRRLFEASVAKLITDGFTSMMLWVLEDNPTCGFYGAMGGKVADEKWEEIGGTKLKELAYGWRKLGA